MEAPIANSGKTISIGRAGTALAGLERHLHPQAAALQLGDEVRQPVICAGPNGPPGRGVVHRASAKTYVIRYVRLPSLINPSATSRQPHGCIVAIADTAGVPAAAAFGGDGPWRALVCRIPESAGPGGYQKSHSSSVPICYQKCPCI